MRRGDTLRAVVPISRRRRTLQSPTNWHTPAFGLVAADEQAERELARLLYEQTAWRITLTFIEPERRSLGICRDAARAHGFRILERTMERPPYIDCGESWASYERTLGRKFSSELRRRRRLLERQGRVTLEVEDGRRSLEPLLEEGFAVEAAGWKGARGTAIASAAKTTTFYRDVASWAADRGWLRLAFLRLDGRTLAFDLALEFDGEHHLLKTGYDPAFRSLGPGKLLRYEMIARAFSVGLDRYEFGGADEPWKLEWTQHRRELRRLDAFPPSAPGAAEWAAFAYGRPLAKRVLARFGR